MRRQQVQQPSTSEQCPMPTTTFDDVAMEEDEEHLSDASATDTDDASYDRLLSSSGYSGAAGRVERRRRQRRERRHRRRLAKLRRERRMQRVSRRDSDISFSIMQKRFSFKYCLRVFHKLGLSVQCRVSFQTE